MNLSFIRIFFGLISACFMILYTTAYPAESLLTKLLVGICMGGAFALFLVSVDTIFRRFSLRIFNTLVIGLFFGYLMGSALTLVFSTIISLASLSIQLHPATVEILSVSLFLFSAYLGTLLTMKAADEIYLHIPFIKFAHSIRRKRDFLIDISALSDVRLIDFSSSGMLNNQLIFPRFLEKYLQQCLDKGDETLKAKARKCLEVKKKLEAMPHLEMRYEETDFMDIEDVHHKMTKLARKLKSNILTSEACLIQLTQNDEIICINLNTLANALKPVMPPGETISIKVQRYGKEPKQGVGYLEDGTMVVINNGGDFVGETIETQVISVKQTSAGRIIFTNAMVEDMQAGGAYSSSYNYDSQSVYEHQHEA